MSRYQPGEIRLGVSMCLLGERVRYDGGHKRHHYVTDVLSEHFTFVPVCPEVDIGLGVPRETLRLVRDGSRMRIVAPASGKDHTEEMTAYARRKVRELGKLDLSGYIMKNGSPSCGMERVPAFTTKGTRAASGRGLFAESLMQANTLLPVEEEGRLGDAALRESFIERVFAYHRLRGLFGGGWTLEQLARFHGAEKFLLTAHSPRAHRQLGDVVTGAKRLGRRLVAQRYQATYMDALSKPVPRRRHVNVLHHLVGCFKKVIDGDEKKELMDVIDDFGRGRVPLVAPLTLIRHHVRRHAVAHLAGQTYLEPHPKELMLRNHA